MLWSHDAIVDTIGGLPSGSTPWSARGISIDSRSAKDGDLFVALRGAIHDGHEHIGDAARAGAVAAIIDRPKAAADTIIPTVLVEDTISALRALGLEARIRNTGAKRIAITGSVGKTGTRHIASHLLSAHGKCHWSHGNLNNHIGAPLSLARMPADAAYGVFELGMNHAGEIAELSPLVAPHYAIITRIAHSHIGHFDSIEAIADAKAEIFTGMTENATAILNADDPFADYLAEIATRNGAGSVITIGMDKTATHRITAISRIANGLEVKAVLGGGTAPGGEKINFTLAMTGSHNAYSAMFALAIAEAENLDRKTSLAALSDIADLDGRGRQHALRMEDGRAFTLIDDSYNASPESVTAALSDLAAHPQQGHGVAPGRRLAVLGDMLELGEAGKALHEDIAPALIEAAPQLLIAFGEGMRAMAARIKNPAIEIILADDAIAAAAMLPDLIRDGDVVLVKSSKGMKSGHIVRTLIAITITGGGAHAG